MIVPDHPTQTANALEALAAAFGHEPEHIHRRLGWDWRVNTALPGALVVACCGYSWDHQHWHPTAHVAVLLSIN